MFQTNLEVFLRVSSKKILNRSVTRKATDLRRFPYYLSSSFLLLAHLALLKFCETPKHNEDDYKLGSHR